MSDTPDTDAQRKMQHRTAMHTGTRQYHEYVLADFARKLERERNEFFWQSAQFAGELRELRTAIRNLRDVKGRHHTQLATEALFKLLPENANVDAQIPASRDSESITD